MKKEQTELSKFLAKKISKNKSETSGVAALTIGDFIYDMVRVDQRYIDGVNVVNWPMSRVLMSFFASKYVKFITGMPIHDSTAGFKCYKREVLETINLDKINFVGYAFQIEMKFKSWKYKFNVIEVPVIFTDRTEGTSKMSGGIFFEAFFGVIQMKLKSLFRKWSR